MVRTIVPVAFVTHWIEKKGAALYLGQLNCPVSRADPDLFVLGV